MGTPYLSLSLPKKKPRASRTILFTFHFSLYPSPYNYPLTTQKKKRSTIRPSKQKSAPRRGADLILGLATAKYCLILLNSSFCRVCYKCIKVLCCKSYTTNSTVLKCNISTWVQCEASLKLATYELGWSIWTAV